MQTEQAQPKKALIYCRASSEGNRGLGDQEYRCKEYARGRNYEIERVFKDVSV